MCMVLVPADSATGSEPLPGSSTVVLNDQLYSYALAPAEAVQQAGFQTLPTAKDVESKGAFDAHSIPI